MVPPPARRHRAPRPALIALLLLLLAGCQAGPRPQALSLDSRLRLAETLEPRTSLALLREAARERPNDGALRERLALVAERAGQEGEAAQAMREAMALQGTTPARLLVLGRLSLRAGDIAAAAEAFSQANALAPTDPAALAGLGLSRDLAGDQAGAQQAYRAALRLAPRDWSLRANLGLSLLLSGQAAEAGDILAEAEYAPDAPKRARHNLALALTGTGRPDRALRLLRRDMGPAEAEATLQEMSAVADQLSPLPVPPPPRQVRRTGEAAAPRLARAVQREELPPLAAPQAESPAASAIVAAAPPMAE